MNFNFVFLRCANEQDDTININTTSNTEFLFDVEAFKFKGVSSNTVFITCQVLVCQVVANSTEECTPCQENRRRRRRDVSNGGYALASQQPEQLTEIRSPIIYIVDPAQRNNKGLQIR